MKILEGRVEYKDRNKDNPIICLYGMTDDEKAYYFLDNTDKKKLSNGNRVASTVLVEAIDPMVRASNVGLVDESGNEVIPCINRTVHPITDNVILVEPATPVSESVIEASKLRNDPLSANQLVSTAATVKAKVNEKMGSDGRYIFNDQCSEATLDNKDGQNLLNGEYYSYIGYKGDNLYLAKNTIDTEVNTFSLVDMKLVEEAPLEYEVVDNPQNIDVNQVEVNDNAVEQAIDEVSAPVEEVPVENNTEDMSYEVVETPVQEAAVETPAEENVNQGFNMDDMQAVTLNEDQIVENNDEQIGEEITVPTEETPVENNETDMSYEVVETPAEENVTNEAVAETPVDIVETPVEEVPVDFKANEEQEVSDDTTDFTQNLDLDFEDKVENSEIDNMVNNEDYFKDYSTVKTDKIENYDDIDYTVNDFDDSRMYRNDTDNRIRTLELFIDDYEGLQKENRSLTDENEKVKAEKESTEKENERLRRELEDARREMNKVYEENEDLKDKVDLVISQNRGLKLKVNELTEKEEQLGRIYEKVESLVDYNHDYTNERTYYRGR